MDDRTLLPLLRDVESDRVERKSSLADKSEIERAICGFANDLPNHGLPGVVFVGVRNDGGCANLEVTDELLRELGSIRSSGNIVPLPSLDVSKRVLDGCAMAVVVVHPNVAPPVLLRGVCWVRVGPQKAIASRDDERRLTEKRQWKDLPYDLHPVPHAPVDDLDLRFFEESYLPSSIDAETLALNNRSRTEQLQALRFLTAEPEPKPTVLGVLVIGKAPENHLPGAYVEFVRIAGRALSDPIRDNKKISGTLAQQVRTLDDLFRIHVNVAVDLTSAATEIRTYDYPIAALQQLSRNALMHRTYEGTFAPVRIYWFDDRVEINSPGGPYGLVTGANFGQAGLTDYRNPHVAEAMRNLGLVQRFGVGIATARKALADNGNPELEFDVQTNFVVARVRRKG